MERRNCQNTPGDIDMGSSLFQAYIITCLINGKRYIGITARGLNRRWSEHIYDARSGRTGMLISRAIAKHGAENFHIEVICSARSWDGICAAEMALIEQHRTKSPNGYNISDGGEGPFGIKKTAESVERSAAKHRGRPCHPNTRAAASRFHKGVKKTPEHCAKIAAGKVGRPRSEAMKAKLRAYWAARREAGEFKTAAPYAHHSRHIAATFRKESPSW